MAALAGPILTLGGFLWVNMTALAVLAVMVFFGLRAVRNAPEPANPESVSDSAT